MRMDFSTFMCEQLLYFPLDQKTKETELTWAKEVLWRLENRSIQQISDLVHTKILLYLNEYSLYTREIDDYCNSIIV